MLRLFIFSLLILISPSSQSKLLDDADFNKVCRISSNNDTISRTYFNSVCRDAKIVQIVGKHDTVLKASVPYCDVEYPIEWSQWNTVLTCKVKN